ncbi:hypothetical protein [Vibrio tapetis]|uniref:Uncharacterized protein n=1 Tax=Vibrio tapetis subsp. tapetis TaxID=1671868 RepID=A0A2N8ZL44_9VIBR|nr:hypothetical protein [Vibrio tapetis]SON52607.1 conserved protein of unknown function [Vibrio tapetis subsp. tapetis]
MAKKNHHLDKVIARLLSDKGFIKNEVEVFLKKEVYKLQPCEILKIKRYATHFGIKAQEKLIEEILDIRRESIISKLSSTIAN